MNVEKLKVANLGNVNSLTVPFFLLKRCPGVAILDKTGCGGHWIHRRSRLHVCTM